MRSNEASQSLFDRAVERLVNEISNARSILAAMRAIGEESSANLFLQVASRCLQTELQVRLIRVFENDNQVASLWYLYRYDSDRVGRLIPVKNLRRFSKKLKLVRDKVFVHIDRDAVFRPQDVYEQAEITWGEIEEAIECAWLVLNRLYSETHGAPFCKSFQSLESLSKDLERDLKRLTQNG